MSTFFLHLPRDDHHLGLVKETLPRLNGGAQIAENSSDIDIVWSLLISLGCLSSLEVSIGIWITSPLASYKLKRGKFWAMNIE